MSNRTATGEPSSTTPESATTSKPTPGRVDSSCVEFFQLLAWRWNITAAKELAQGREPEGRLDTRDWAGMLHLIVIDAAHAARVDLSEPLIVAPVPNGGTLIIDGWHRLHKALNTGVTELFAVVLTAEEELACRIFGGESDDEDEDHEDEDEADGREDGLEND